MAAIRNWKSLQDHKNRIDDFFKMECDLCDFHVTSLEHAKLHYIEEHNISDGYLKCNCGDIKFKTNNSLYDHIEYHLGNNPDRYKYKFIISNYVTKIIKFSDFISSIDVICAIRFSFDSPI